MLIFLPFEVFIFSVSYVCLASGSSFEFQEPFKKWGSEKAYDQKGVEYFPRKQRLSNIEAENNRNDYSYSNDGHVQEKRVFKSVYYCHFLPVSTPH